MCLFSFFKCKTSLNTLEKKQINPYRNTHSSADHQGEGGPEVVKGTTFKAWLMVPMEPDVLVTGNPLRHTPSASGEGWGL